MMKKREARRQRDRDQLPPTLQGLAQLIPADTDSRKYLEENYGSVATHSAGEQLSPDVGEQDSVITGAGLEKLVTALGDACPDGPMDLVRIARRVPRSQSTVESVHIAELCFAISQFTSPVNVHERRRNNAAQMTPVDESTALMQYYKGRRFRAIVHGEDPSSPGIRGEGGASGNTEDDAETAEEWKAFLASASTPLPMTLRVHKSEKVLEQAALRILGSQAVNATVRPTTVLPPSTLMYSCSNREYHARPDVEYVCRTLHSATAASFQEMVSAIPVLVLGVEPHHTVLDMCAAPGSKTLQGLDEMLRNGWDAPELKKGVLIANEKDRVKATQTLPARLKRFHAPHVMSTRCDAVQWPRLYVTEGGTLGQYKDDETNNPVEQRFDRIICDVPCSGDGTIRKEPSVAATWSGGYVKSLVATQKALLRRGLDLLADGGVLVYSTCSINPKEDEEVVCGALELFGEAVELLNVNTILAEKGAKLHSSGGIASPNVESLQRPVLPTNFDGGKVLRVLPHRDDTGGFFVAAFRKVRHLDSTPPKVIRNKLNLWTKSKLWTPVAHDDPVWAGIAAFYGFDHLNEKSFSYYPACCHRETSAQGLVPVYHLNPHGGPTRRIVLATPALASMLFGTRPYKGPGVEVVCVGVRAFEAYDGRYLSQAECRWRAVIEAASYLTPRFSKRKMLFRASPDRNRKLLKELLHNGFVYVREYWQEILCDPTVASLNTSTADDAFPFVKGGPLKALLASIGKQMQEDPELSGKVCELLATELQVGGVVVGLLPDCDTKEEPWFMSATLSGNKLELATDASLRTYGLMTYLGVYENCEKCTNGSGLNRSTANGDEGSDDHSAENEDAFVDVEA